MKFTTAQDTDVCELKEIWRDIFKDTDAYLDLFFSSKMKPEFTMIARNETEIASVVYMVDAPLILKNGEIIPAFYMCGIATRPNYRGQGLAGKLINMAFETAKKKGAKVCYLIPANLPLFDFYKSFGMQTFAYMHKAELDGAQAVIPPYTCEKDIEKVKMYYDVKPVAFKPFRSEKDWKYIYACYENVLLFENGYMVMPEEEDCVILAEQSFDGLEIAKAIAFQKGKKLKVMLPGTNADTPFAVVKYLDESVALQDGYINLMLN